MATTTEMFQSGLAHHQRGQLREAEAIYRQILAADPGHADSLHLLGVVAMQVNQHQLAIDHIRRAIDLAGNQPIYHCNLGEAYRAAGRLAEAAECYHQALRIDPQLPQAHNNLGNVLKALGKTDEAAAAYRRAIQSQPNYAEPHNNLAAILQEQGDLAAAVEHYRQAVAINPRYVGAHKNLGTALRGLGQLAEAAECFRQILRLNPQDSDAHLNLGMLYHAEKRYDAARDSYRRASELRPESAEAFNHLGALYIEQNRLDLALESYGKALELQPGSAETLSSLGTVLQMQGKPAESIAYHRRALAILPERPQTHFSLGAAYHLLGQADEALASYTQAIRLKLDYAEAYYNRSFVWLSLGNLPAGWRDYEWRFKCKGYQARQFDAPRWDGSPLAGRTLLVHAEQGIGDTLHFIRYLKLAESRGGKVLAEVPAGLLPLLKDSGFESVIGQGLPLPHFDVQIPLMSLPGVFGTTLESVPADIPYLAANPQLIARWHERLEGYEGFKVGIAWQGNRAYAEDHYRSMPLSWFGVLAQVPGVQLFSLQKGPGSEQLQVLAGQFSVVDLGGEADNEGGAFMDTAAIIKNLDLVVSADTANVHLAAALGVPVWVAQPIPPDWRWMMTGDTSPWYPTLRLFRQTESGDWRPVFEHMAAELRAIA